MGVEKGQLQRKQIIPMSSHHRQDKNLTIAIKRQDERDRIPPLAVQNEVLGLPWLPAELLPITSTPPLQPSLCKN